MVRPFNDLNLREVGRTLVGYHRTVGVNDEPYDLRTREHGPDCVVEERGTVEVPIVLARDALARMTHRHEGDDPHAEAHAVSRLAARCSDPLMAHHRPTLVMTPHHPTQSRPTVPVPEIHVDSRSVA